jgi:predicted alpha/beta-fold hydrolase
MGVVGEKAWLPPDSERPFRPYPGLAGFHRMTLAGGLLRSERWHRHPPSVDREVPLAGDAATIVSCSWQAETGAPVLLLVHGMGGSAKSAYLRGTARRAWAAGMHVLSVQLRGASGTEHLSDRGYHAGLVDDVRATLATLVRGRGLGPVLLAGFSLGGNVVLRLAALDGPEVAAGVAAISPSVDLGLCSRALDDDPALSLYRDSFVRSLKASVRRRASHRPGCVDLEVLQAVRTLREFDAGFTATSHGFADVDDYYRKASSAPLLGDIALPTLVIHARDDRLVPVEGLLNSAAPGNPWIRLSITERGGHCAFIGRSVPWPAGGRATGSAAVLPGFWAEERLIAFLGEVALEHASAPGTFVPA